MWQYLNNPRLAPGVRHIWLFQSRQNLIIVSNCRPDYSNILIIFFNVLSLLNSKWNSKKRCI